jgi:hypothetical protein
VNRFIPLLLAALSAAAQTPPPAPPPPAAAPAKPQQAMGSTAMRNENVAVFLIDTNAAKESNIRAGSQVALITEAVVESNYFAADQGRPASGAFTFNSPRRSAGWHGELYHRHQNSILNARTFFQVGPVQPGRQNAYGARATGDLGKAGFLTANFGQRKVRGMVNGNVLVPLSSERSSTSTDPAIRAVVNRFFQAYPDVLPNRTDFDPRALNTNAPQRIDETNYDLRLDTNLSPKNRLGLFYSNARQNIDAFQFVAGQNPDTTLDNHTARATFNRGGLQLTAQFQRAISLLLPEPNAVGPRVRFGYQIEELGPDSGFPVDRAQNTFRYGFVYTRSLDGGRHDIHIGGDYQRLQLNSIESNNIRGYFSFQNNFGRSAIENFRLGIPNVYEVVLGDMARGFRQSAGNLYVSDRIRLSPTLQLYLGLRYSPEGSPFEVTGRGPIPYPCDCNNLAPRVSLAWRMRNNWTSRAMYSLSYAPVPPVTYQQVRSNPPFAQYLTINNPDFLNPLRDLSTSNIASQPALNVLPDKLLSPYAHLYSFVLERQSTTRGMLRFGYTGSRSMKLLTGIVLNRAVPHPTIPYTTATINDRRPDPSVGELRTVQNNGIAYYDGAQVSYDLPYRRGVNLGVSYTFGKAVDTGVDFTGTAANRDMLNGRAQSQFDHFGDRKGLSNFDAKHAVALRWLYDLPWQGIQLSGISTFRTGTPFTLYIGSDSPGFGNVDGSGGDRPNILDPSILGRTISHPDIAPLILARDKFSYMTPPDQAGNLGRNVMRKASIANWNLALQKSWRLRALREAQLQLRGEAYNGFNTPQFDEPQRNHTSPAFGKITNTLNDGRVFQLGLRVIL